MLLPALFKEALAQTGFDMADIELMAVDPLYDFYYPEGTRFRKYGNEDQQLHIERLLTICLVFYRSTLM